MWACGCVPVFQTDILLNLMGSGIYSRYALQVFVAYVGLIKFLSHFLFPYDY